MAKELEREVNLGAGTVTVTLQDEFGVISKHTVDITSTEGKSVDELSEGFRVERDERVTRMLPHLEKLSPDHAQIAANIKHLRKVKNAGSDSKA